MRIAIIGAGYVGLVTGACLADFGHAVRCADKDPAKIDALQRGRIPIYEPGLDDLVARNMAEGRLSFGSDLCWAVEGADAVFIAVGTPSRRGDGHADLTYVYQAARGIAQALKGYAVVVTKSTVPVGTGDEVERMIREARPDLHFSVASNPEFLREGAAIEDFKRPDRIIIGVEDDSARAVMADIYRPLCAGHAPLIFTTRRTAELTKYAANAFLATKITFINEIADLCEMVGADVRDVSKGIGLDTRIGQKFLDAGPGFGGSCFPKDVSALIKTAHDHGTSLRIAETVAEVNERRKRAMSRRVIAACGGSVRGKTICLLGLTFKPNTDDMRDSPAIALVQALEDAGAWVRAYDPEGMEQAALILNEVEYAGDPYEAALGTDALVLVTDWDVFRRLDLKRLRDGMRWPIMVDLRNIYSSTEVEAAGFLYTCIGNGRSRPLLPLIATS
ncbi:nucleotide sugar dehydrogenase [Pseudoroseomonas wenyumeiae]|uniref:UDP-glucose 6-dehydrogenase n=1 Tax=Teichococcus wenyumeiae TaxID=2478470 RepID=A0A3A9JLF8_9PROT|nr:UDP-glucose/GDP-mannose dehydrogenase family protein [Pseudoroseomonas wenyumeiae]RKK05385.1 UDP-glucose/GDP-mannose dehydrogenase family protein [Pseudoroseomonas wenyumeiae]RMI19138.1 nucleotide sugar dehydrogenase [Pseudoroseomonas wenyumeiae]